MMIKVIKHVEIDVEQSDEDKGIIIGLIQEFLRK
jgi:hypothetical protein